MCQTKLFRELSEDLKFPNNTSFFSCSLIQDSLFEKYFPLFQEKSHIITTSSPPTTNTAYLSYSHLFTRTRKTGSRIGSSIISRTRNLNYDLCPHLCIINHDRIIKPSNLKRRWNNYWYLTKLKINPPKNNNKKRDENNYCSFFMHIYELFFLLFLSALPSIYLAFVHPISNINLLPFYQLFYPFL